MVDPISPQELMQMVAKQLTSTYSECNMESVETFMETFDEAQKFSENLKVLEGVKKSLTEFKSKLDDYVDNPRKLGAAWAHNNPCCPKLKDISTGVEDEIAALRAFMMELNETVPPLQEALEKVSDDLEGTRKLANLPKVVSTWADSVTGPEDMASIDTDPIKRCLVVNELSGALDTAAGLRVSWAEQSSSCREGLKRISDFRDKVPVILKKSFVCPGDDCGCYSGLLSGPVPPLVQTDLLESARSILAEDFATLLKRLDAVDAVRNTEPAEVSNPVQQFAKSVTKAIGPLESILGHVSNGNETGCFSQVMGTRFPLKVV